MAAALIIALVLVTNQFGRFGVRGNTRVAEQRGQPNLPLGVGGGPFTLVRVTAQLTASAAAPLAAGSASYTVSVSNDSGRIEPGSKRLQVEVTKVGLPDEGLRVAVDGQQIGVLYYGSIAGFLPGSLGPVRFLYLVAAMGDTVPTIRDGSTIEIRSSDGTLLLSGTFQ
jgi:hypothetical protein